MLTKAGLDFILHITNYFHGAYETPDWGRRPQSQILIGLAVRELADGIEDPALRGQAQTAANEVIAKSSQHGAKS
jgi:hypothetical protein